ncbi:reverse transcriptase domain-containing protein [Exiguobacterium chiriqhucha]|uniref:RNA-directed DNA polymerase n=1 Tax=Exiguobacterium chiriqhucha RW-2 TaxID=1345023 RepID=U1M145_9BACL|nr:reverse transcriptase domain-containing protein [Exiguobacterium chiriqhucha]ERG68412.1 hypothetical protein M467_14120 [Exiguobacterium chiriqhucha RW-2]
MNNPFSNLTVKLKKSDDELINAFGSLSTFEDVASILEVSSHALWIILVKNKPYNYREASIPKKDGGERKVYIPNNNLFILQQKLKYVLELIYSPHFTSHGFVNDRSIISNAERHVNKKFVINIDLKDFFPTIKYNRIVNMFVKVFRCSPNIANTLANIVTHHEGFLPQGSPISPLISNVIARTMDDQLFKLCKEIKEVQYTRYADDLTFSTNRKKIPNSIVKNSNNSYELSDKLINIIENNGFEINYKKFRVQSEYDHQSVTGIKVNKKLNINKSYIRMVRVYLYIFEKNEDINQAIKEFNLRRPKKSNLKHRLIKNEFQNQIFHLKVLKGMIEFIGSVRGRRDRIFNKFSKRFNTICETAGLNNIQINIPLLLEEVIDNKILVVGNNDQYFYTLDQGINTKEISLSKSLAVSNNERGIISTKANWTTFRDDFEGTHYYDFHTIPLYRKNTTDVLSYLKINRVAENDLIYFEGPEELTKNLQEINTEIESLKIGNVILVGLHNNTIEIFEGILTKRILFGESKFIFKPISNENLPISFGFVFNQVGNLVGTLSRGNSELYVNSIK